MSSNEEGQLLIYYASSYQRVLCHMMEALSIKQLLVLASLIYLVVWVVVVVVVGV